MAIQKLGGFAAVALAGVMVVSATSAAAQVPMRVGGTVKEPMRIKTVVPVYPPIAVAAKVQGAVILEAVINTSGRVTDLRVLRSNPLFDSAAVAAVKQWEYAPTLLNGAPIDVIMTVVVNFKLSPGSQPSVSIPPPAGAGDTAIAVAQPPGPILTGPGDSRAIVVPSGYAIVDVTIGKDGAVRDVKLIKGDPILAAGTLDAIRTWRYAPTLLNGAPIEVQMTVLVPVTVKGAGN